ncbi:MAG: 23S rRNA (guanosine(2251)-2'-O)-methyltransferase RlmB [Erysipelotrichaceae bacterium]
MSQYVYGRNVVKQLLKDGKQVHEIVILEGLKDRDLEQSVQRAKVNVRTMGRKKMDQLLQTDNHQGIAALIDDYKMYSLEEVLHAIPNGKMPLLLMLDGIEDPHNLGAMLRISDAIGVDGIIIGKHRSVSLTPTVAKVSTGAIDTVKVAQVTNLVKTIETLKEKGYWVIGSDLENSKDYTQGTYDVPLVLVIGNEGAGMSQLVKKNCDYCISLPMIGTVQSLNASVACGIMLYEINNQRRSKLK